MFPPGIAAFICSNINGNYIIFLTLYLFFEWMFVQAQVLSFSKYTKHKIC